MTLDNMTGITKGSYTGDMFCKSQLITCKRVKKCDGICPKINQIIHDALPYAETKTGKWLMRDGVYGATYCSECDYELRINDVNYCPNCGARMVREDGG